MGFLSALRDLFTPPASAGRCQRVPTVPPRRGRAIEIKRNTLPFHQERGWTLRGKTLRGHYRTRHGSFEGKIEAPHSKKPQFFIIRPPEQLLDGPHGACFMERARGLFWIHFSPKPKDIDAGIKTVENALLEALS